MVPRTAEAWCPGWQDRVLLCYLPIWKTHQYRLLVETVPHLSPSPQKLCSELAREGRVQGGEAEGQTLAALWWDHEH